MAQVAGKKNRSKLSEEKMLAAVMLEPAGPTCS